MHVIKHLPKSTGIVLLHSFMKMVSVFASPKTLQVQKINTKQTPHLMLDNVLCMVQFTRYSTTHVSFIRDNSSMTLSILHKVLLRFFYCSRKQNMFDDDKSVMHLELINYFYIFKTFNRIKVAKKFLQYFLCQILQYFKHRTN